MPYPHFYHRPISECPQHNQPEAGVQRTYSLWQQPNSAVNISSSTHTNSTAAAARLGDPVDPLIIRIHEYQPALFEFSNFRAPSLDPARIRSFIPKALEALRDAQGTLQPFDDIVGNFFSYTDRSSLPILNLTLRGMTGRFWGLCYEDVEEVINALEVYVRVWFQGGSRPKAARVRVFRDGRMLSTLGALEAGVMANLW